MSPPETPRSFYQRVWLITGQIPAGTVATYGQIAKLAGCNARQAGWAMAAVPDGSVVPWHRVINAKGEIAERSQGGGGEAAQMRLLKAEGIKFDRRGRVDLALYRWPGPSWAWLAANGFDPESAA